MAEQPGDRLREAYQQAWTHGPGPKSRPRRQAGVGALAMYAVGKLVKAIQGVRILGLGRSLHVVQYSLLKAWLERRYGAGPLPWPSGGLPPGPLQEVDMQPWGARFEFDRARLELRFLAPDVARVTWTPGAEPIPYALTRREWDEPTVSVDGDDGAGWTFATEGLQVAVSPDGTLQFLEGGAVLREDSPPERDGERWTYRGRLRPEERIHGLGERAAGFNLRGGTYEMWNSGPGGRYGPGHDPLYLCIPTYLGLHDQGSYLVFFENPSRALFSFGEGAEACFTGGALRYYVVPGPAERALERYAELTGHPPLPPVWALGYQQARWGYRSAAQVRDVVDGFRRRDLPLSGIQLDIDYMSDYRSFTIDEEAFPEMATLTADLARLGVKVTGIVDPGLKRDRGYPIFTDGLAGRRYCTLPAGKPSYGVVWPGWSAFPDFSDEEVRTWWGQHYRLLLDQGIVGFWHDMNEPGTFTLNVDSALPAATRHSMEGRGADHAEARNLYGLLMGRAGYEGLLRHQPDRRPFLLSRAGWAGIQRYAWTWTGDTESSWPMLRQTVQTVLGLGMSGVPFSGPDIGGFRGSPSPELYLRWFQLSTFLPFFRTHSARDSEDREPWTAAPDHLNAIRSLLLLRYRLMPYLYTVVWHASRTGHPPVRPLFWPDGRNPALWPVEDAFLLGDALLVAPVLEQGASGRTVQLPPTVWHDFWHDETFEGGQEVWLSGPLQRIPLLVRGGSVIPFEEDGALVLEVFPPEDGGEGSGLLYRDDGDGYGPWRVDRYAVSVRGTRLRLEATSEGDFDPGDTPVAVRLRGAARDARRVWVDGTEVPFTPPLVSVGSFGVFEVELS